MIPMPSCPQCEFYFVLDLVEVGDYRHRANHLACRAAADVLYEVLTIMVKKGPLSVEGRSHEL
jgi:agmatinase